MGAAVRGLSIGLLCSERSTQRMAAPAATDQAWEAVIGLETHVQLGTNSKIFTAASTAFGDDPNTHIDPVVCGLPGTLPVLNQKVLEYAVKAAMAEPLACGWHAVVLGQRTLGRPLSACSALVIGGGAIGFGAALSLRAFGIELGVRALCSWLPSLACSSRTV